MFNIILQKKQEFIGENETPYTSKYLEARECNFIIKAFSEINYLVQDKEIKNHYISENYQKKDYTFYITANDIKEALEMIERQFMAFYPNEIEAFAEYLKLKEYHGYLEKDAFDAPLRIKEKIVYSWETLEVKNTETSSLIIDKNY